MARGSMHKVWFISTWPRLSTSDLGREGQPLIDLCLFFSHFCAGFFYFISYFTYTYKTYDLKCLGQFPGNCCENVCFRFELSSVAFIHLFMNVSLEKTVFTFISMVNQHHIFPALYVVKFNTSTLSVAFGIRYKHFEIGWTALCRN